MSKINYREKWEKRIIELLKHPETKPIDIVLIESAFGHQLAWLEEDDRFLLWDNVRNMAKLEKVKKRDVNLVLKRMYDIQQGNKYSHFTGEEDYNIYLQKFISLYLPDPIDKTDIVSTLFYENPYAFFRDLVDTSILYELVSFFKGKRKRKIDEDEIIDLQIIRCKECEYLFPHCEDTQQIFEFFPNDSWGYIEAFSKASRQIIKLIDKLLYKYCFQNVLMTNEFLTIPELVQSVLPYVGMEDALSIKQRVEFEEATLIVKRHDEKKYYPNVVYHNLRELKKSIQDRIDNI